MGIEILQRCLLTGNCCAYTFQMDFWKWLHILFVTGSFDSMDDLLAEHLQEKKPETAESVESDPAA